MAHVSLGKMSFDFFCALEQKLHRPEIRHSAEALDELLADEFLEFASSGDVFDKAMVMQALMREPAGNGAPVVDVHDLDVRSVASDVVLVTYRSVHRPNDMAMEKTVRRSSIWSRMGGRWQMVFHQGTIIPPR